MLDVFDIPTKSKANTKIYFGGVATGPQVWQKPRGASMIRIFAVGGGGGGGAGAPAGAESTSAGGGGGGSSAQGSITYPAWAIPDRLFVQPGNGGLAGTAGVGGTGTASSVYINVISTTAQDLLISVNNGAGGGVGSGATAGAAGGSGASAGASNAPLCGLALAPVFISTSGQVGIIGGTTIAGAALTLPTTGLVVTGGTGGGGIGAAASTGFAGGLFTTPGYPFPPQAGGIAGGTTTSSGGRGSNGFQVPGLLYFYGGTGGASSGGAGGSGGDGGAGSYGCGGGGGGGTFTGGTQSKGGAGGPGLVIITSW